MTNPKNFYWKFTVKPDRIEIWKAIASYRALFQRLPTTVLASPNDDVIIKMLNHIGMDVLPDPHVPNGQLWFHVPFGFYLEEQ